MTIPHRGRRLIRTQDAEYAWYIRKKPTYFQGAFQASMTMAIQAAAVKGGCVLVVNLVVSRPDNWIEPHQTALKPSTVRKIIAGALSSGWVPSSTGGPFLYEYPLILDVP